MSPLLHLLHVGALVLYLLATLLLVLGLLPAAARTSDPLVQRRLLARWLGPYNVASIGALGVLIVSGAVALTDLKARFGAAYLGLLWPLVGKLTLTFLLTMTATYVSFGLAHRVVRAEQGGLPVDAAWQRGMLRRMRGAAWLGLALALWTAWVGYGLGRVAATLPVVAPAVRSS